MKNTRSRKVTYSKRGRADAEEFQSDQRGQGSVKS